ncbi:MAG: hypothetical protein M1609_01835 [Firmicutes bacterium]|nr:hypothetical protein [Bacillota bacterium]
MSDVLMGFYLVISTGLVIVLLYHAALRHRRIVSSLTCWAFIGVFVSTIGGFLLLGTFTPNMADYSKTSSEIYNAFTWGGIALPEYNDMLEKINDLGIIINAMGLGVLIMATLSGFFPRSFFTYARAENQTETHGGSNKHI